MQQQKNIKSTFNKPNNDCIKFANKSITVYADFKLVNSKQNTLNRCDYYQKFPHCMQLKNRQYAFQRTQQK